MPESYREMIRHKSAEEKNTYLLQTQLEEYASKGMYPFHMPGHKRRMQPAPGLPAGWDITEVPGTDDLHDASGILKDAMDRTAELWGADRTWYLVNGSTCGLLAGIRALAPRGSEVLCARNCHKAVFHALELAGYKVHWIMPPIDPAWGICGSISAARTAAALRRHPMVRAVILTSPTYEGVLSDIKGICAVCHAKKIPVLVDEAHGAHLLPVSRRAGFPAGALACGADVVIQSPHKTLPSLTQTAFLHLQGELVKPGRIEDELDLFETSSPSYPLLASLDGCTGIVRLRGEALFEQWSQRIGRFDNRVRCLKKIRILWHTPPGEAENGKLSDSPEISDAFYDPGKILIDASAAGLTGAALAALLRDKWMMETEMTRGNLLLAMTSVCDDEDALDRLAEALIEIEASAAASAGEKTVGAGFLNNALTALRPAVVMSIAEACGQETEEVPLDQAQGRISARYMYFYPPGIPFLAPGELITREILQMLIKVRQSGAHVYREDGESILCLRE